MREAHLTTAKVAVSSLVIPNESQRRSRRASEAGKSEESERERSARGKVARVVRLKRTASPTLTLTSAGHAPSSSSERVSLLLTGTPVYQIRISRRDSILCPTFLGRRKEGEEAAQDGVCLHETHGGRRLIDEGLAARVIAGDKHPSHTRALLADSHASLLCVTAPAFLVTKSLLESVGRRWAHRSAAGDCRSLREILSPFHHNDFIQMSVEFIR